MCVVYSMSVCVCVCVWMCVCVCTCTCIRVHVNMSICCVHGETSLSNEDVRIQFVLLIG